MKPNTSATLKFGVSDCVLVMRCDLAARVQVLRETLQRRRIRKAPCVGIVLVVILQRQGVFGGCAGKSRFGYGLVGDEIGRLSEEHILRKVKRRREIGIRRRKQVLAVRQLGSSAGRARLGSIFAGPVADCANGITAPPVSVSTSYCWRQRPMPPGCGRR